MKSLLYAILIFTVLSGWIGSLELEYIPERRVNDATREVAAFGITDTNNDMARVLIYTCIPTGTSDAVINMVHPIVDRRKMATLIVERTKGKNGVIKITCEEYKLLYTLAVPFSSDDEIFDYVSAIKNDVIVISGSRKTGNATLRVPEIRVSFESGISAK